MGPLTLDLDAGDLASCVSCGLCLPHCPTFRVTGDEARSPRGRITAMRGVVSGVLQLDDRSVVESMETCVQCRGCETACPSAVPFGSLMVATRAAVARGPRRPASTARGVALGMLSFRRVVRGLSLLAAVLQRVGVVPSRRLGLPRRLPLRRRPLRSSGRDVWIAPGCVMDAWFRDVNADLAALVEATGRGVAVPDSSPCCGALAEHAGLTDLAARQARQVISALPGDAPILVTAAGCGAMMKDYATVVGTDEAARFAARVVDANEWLAAHLHELALPSREADTGPVAIQDPCHLRHVQRAHLPVRAVVGAAAEVRELDDEGLCCGAGGAFALAHPDLADQIRERKVAAIARSGAPVVASANPGCAIHLQWAGLDVRHPVSMLADAAGVARGR